MSNTLSPEELARAGKGEDGVWDGVPQTAAQRKAKEIMDKRMKDEAEKGLDPNAPAISPVQDQDENDDNDAGDGKGKRKVVEQKPVKGSANRR